MADPVARTRPKRSGNPDPDAPTCAPAPAPVDDEATVELSLEANIIADAVVICEGATLTTHARLRVKESVWQAAQSWLAERDIARHITVEE